MQTGNDGSRQGNDGFGLGGNATRHFLPPGPTGAFEKVPDGVLGSNKGNSNDYSLDNPRPLGISMNIGTAKGKFSPPMSGLSQSPPTGTGEPGSSGTGGWAYYDPNGGVGISKRSDDFSEPYPLRIGNDDLRRPEKDGLNLNGTANGSTLPPGPDGALLNVPDWLLGSNKGNDHNYSLDNSKPPGISMDTGTEKEVNPSIWSNKNLLRQTNQTQPTGNSFLPQPDTDNFARTIAGPPLADGIPPAPGQKSGRFFAVLPYIFKWENVYDKHGNVIAEHDKNDRGGVTKYGIDKKSHPHVDVENLTKKQAIEIHWQEWRKSGAENLPYPLGELYFSTMSNGGGDDLLKRSGGDPNRFVELQKQRYETLSKGKGQSGFLKGWLNRADDARSYFLINR